MPKQSDDLSRKGEPSQETERAKLKIPVPKKQDFHDLLDRAGKKKPSQSEKEKPQTSPDQ